MSKITEDKKQPDTIRTKISKGVLKAALARRYKGSIADKVTAKLPELKTQHMEFEPFVELIERLMNFEQDRLMRIAFEVYDFNKDKLIDELDTYTCV